VQLPSGLGQIFLPHLLALQKMHPGLHLTLSLDDRIADLVTEGVDVALRLSSEPPPGMRRACWRVLKPRSLPPRVLKRCMRQRAGRPSARTFQRHRAGRAAAAGLG
jgi:DNA-binding transcriptional LysR family regulator